MCDKVMVCHGDKTELLKNAYNKRQAHMVGEGDCKPATFYITNDGKYAVDADFVSIADLNNPEFDLDRVPKIKLG